MGFPVLAGHGAEIDSGTAGGRLIFGIFMRSYANPNLMQRAKCRPSFTRAGFSVIDCPLLTNHGKNSADIHMVPDAIELLEHSTRFDEFIVLLEIPTQVGRR